MPLRAALRDFLDAHSGGDVVAEWRATKPIEPQLSAARILTMAHSTGDMTIAGGLWMAARNALKADAYADISNLISPVPQPPPAA